MLRISINESCIEVIQKGRALKIICIPILKTNFYMKFLIIQKSKNYIV